MKLMSVTTEKFNELTTVYSAHSIANENRLKGISMIHGKLYTTTALGADGTGTKYGYLHVNIQEVVPEDAYKGPLKPLTYGDHFGEVYAGKRKRSYDGLKTIYQGRWYVLIGEEIIITRPKVPQNTQLELF